MEDGEIAEFYIWMNRQFPADIGQIQGATFFGGPVQIRMLRDSALVSMRSRGISRSSFRIEALPDLKWLSAQRAYVEEAHFRHRWQVETPEGLLRMAAENSVPWYLKEQYQVILLIGALWPCRRDRQLHHCGWHRGASCLDSLQRDLPRPCRSVIRLRLLDRRPEQ